MSLASFMAALDEGDDPGVALVDRIVATVADRELATLVEACAVPRRVDATIVGVLRCSPEDVAGNARLLRELCEYPFVKPREGGGFVYHDGVRVPLLARFRDERRAALRELTGRLVVHFEAEHSAARALEEDAARVGRIVQKANFARYRTLAATLETRLLTPLLEALYQHSLLSARSALEFLEAQLASYEDSGRYTVCRVLIGGAREAVAGLEDDGTADSVLEWLAYWDGRLLERTERAVRAERVLAPLASVTQRDLRLRQSALGELGLALRRQFRLRAARATFEAAVSVHEASRDDRANLPFSHLRLAGTLVLLEQPEVAVVQQRKALKLASGPRALVCALTELADAELRCGHRDEALASALRALDLARMQLRDVRSPHLALGEVLSACFAEEDPVLLDTVLAETEALLAGLGDPIPLVRRAIERARLLRLSGQRRRARAALARVETAVGALAAAGVRAEFAYERGALALDEERHSEALEHFALAADAAAGSQRPGLALDAEHQRARVLAAIGRVDEAATALAEVERRWDDCGHEMLAALASAELAALLARSGGDRAAAARGDRGARPGGEHDATSGGDHGATSGGDHDATSGGDHGARSDALIGAASARLAGASLELRVRLLMAKAEHASARGRASAATEYLAEAAALSRRRGRVGDVARFSDASALAARDAFVRSPSVRAADRDNAEAVRCLLAGEATALDTARDHLGAALSRSPAPWYRLNHAYASAHRGDWAEAVAMLTQALDEAPRLRCDALEARLGEFHVARDEALLKAGRYEDAAEAFAGSLAALDRPPQALSRSRCLTGRGDSLRAAGELCAAADAYREAEAAGAPAASLHLGELLAATGDDCAARAAYRRATTAGDDDLAAQAVLRLLDLPREDAAGPLAVPSSDSAAATPLPASCPAATPAAGDRDAAVVHEVGAAGPRAALMLGDRLLAAGRPAAAEVAFRLADPELPEATLRLARLRSDLELYERAERSGRRAVALQAATELGDLLAAKGDAVAAAAAYRRALGRGPAPWAAVKLSRLLVREGRLVEAEQLLRRAVSGARSEPRAAAAATLALADLHAATGRGAIAGRTYRDLLACPDPETAAAAASRLLADEGDGALDSILAAGARVALRLGRRLLDRGDVATAETLLRRAAERPDDLYAPGAALALGDLLGGDTEQGRAAYERALESGNPWVAPEAAVRLRELGSAEAIERALALGGLAALRLGRLLAATGEHATAGPALRRAATEPVFAAEALQALAEIEPEGAL